MLFPHWLTWRWHSAEVYHLSPCPYPSFFQHGLEPFLDCHFCHETFKSTYRNIPELQAGKRFTTSTLKVFSRQFRTFLRSISKSHEENPLSKPTPWFHNQTVHCQLGNLSVKQIESIISSMLWCWGSGWKTGTVTRWNIFGMLPPSVLVWSIVKTCRGGPANQFIVHYFVLWLHYQINLYIYIYAHILPYTSDVYLFLYIYNVSKSSQVPFPSTCTSCFLLFSPSSPTPNAKKRRLT